MKLQIKIHLQIHIWLKQRAPFVTSLKHKHINMQL